MSARRVIASDFLTPIIHTCRIYVSARVCVLRVMCELKAFQVSCFLVNRLLSEGVCYDLGESRYGSMRAFIYDCAKFSFACVCTCIYLYFIISIFFPLFTLSIMYRRTLFTISTSVIVLLSDHYWIMQRRIEMRLGNFLLHISSLNSLFLY